MVHSLMQAAGPNSFPSCGPVIFCCGVALPVEFARRRRRRRSAQAPATDRSRCGGALVGRKLSNSTQRSGFNFRCCLACRMSTIRCYTTVSKSPRLVAGAPSLYRKDVRRHRPNGRLEPADAWSPDGPHGRRLSGRRRLFVHLRDQARFVERGKSLRGFAAHAAGSRRRRIRSASGSD
jgi:hypothetical protein